MLARASAGEREAKERLLLHNLAGLRGFVRLRLGAGLRAREDSEDLVQSVCREVLEDLTAVRVDSAAEFRHWLFRAVEHKLIDRARFWGQAKRAGTPPGSEVDAREIVDGYSVICSPSRNLEAKEQIASIERAFDRLPKSYQEVIVLARVEGLSGGEIAHHLGHSEAYARTLLARALARMSTLLELESE